MQASTGGDEQPGPSASQRPPRRRPPLALSPERLAVGVGAIAAAAAGFQFIPPWTQLLIAALLFVYIVAFSEPSLRTTATVLVILIFFVSVGAFANRRAGDDGARAAGPSTPGSPPTPTAAPSSPRGDLTDPGACAPDKQKTTVDLMRAAPTARWTSASKQTIPYGNAPPGSSQQDRDRVQKHGNAAVLDANAEIVNSRDFASPAQPVLRTTPPWFPNTWISGDFTLPIPLANGSRFVSGVGFVAYPPDNPNYERPPPGGRVVFSVFILPHPGASALEVVRVRDTANNHVIPVIDKDLSRFTGARVIRLRVDSDGDQTDDWAAWFAPRIVSC
jgi:hypothetical protein